MGRGSIVDFAGGSNPTLRKILNRSHLFLPLSWRHSATKSQHGCFEKLGSEMPLNPQRQGNFGIRAKDGRPSRRAGGGGTGSSQWLIKEIVHEPQHVQMLVETFVMRPQSKETTGVCTQREWNPNSSARCGQARGKRRKREKKIDVTGMSKRGSNPNFKSDVWTGNRIQTERRR